MTSLQQAGTLVQSPSCLDWSGYLEIARTSPRILSAKTVQSRDTGDDYWDTRIIEFYIDINTICRFINELYNLFALYFTGIRLNSIKK
jgi:hypothetical protein